MRFFIIAFIFSQSMWIGFASDGAETLQQGKTLVMQGENMQAAKSLHIASNSPDPNIRNMAAFWLDYADIPASRSEQFLTEANILASLGNREAGYDVLEKTIQKDPFSYEAHKALGLLYLTKPQFCEICMGCSSCNYQSIPFAAKQEIWTLLALAKNPREKLQAMHLKYQYYLNRSSEFKCAAQCCSPPLPFECIQINLKEAANFAQSASKVAREIIAYEAKLKKAGIAPVRAGE